MSELACEICGSQPSARFVIRRHVGMLVFQRFYRVDALLCRAHAMSLSKQFLKRTLVQGWWGITSFFFNIAAVIGDVAVLVRASALEAPIPAMPAAPPSG